MLIVQNICAEDLEIDTYIIVNLIQQWCCINFLKINEIKTKLLLLGFGKTNLRNYFNLFLNDQIIEQIDNLKYLGVLIDNKLNFNEHITKCCSKLNSSIFVLKLLANYCDIKMLLNVYYAIVFSHLNYCISVWANSCVKSLKKVFTAQKKAIRAIFKLNNRDHCRDYFIKYEILTFPALINYSLVCSYKDETVGLIGSPTSTCHGHNTRNRMISQVTTKNKLLLKGKQVYDKLPKGIKKETNKYVFKTKLKKHLASECPYAVIAP